MKSNATRIVMFRRLRDIHKTFKGSKLSWKRPDHPGIWVDWYLHDRKGRLVAKLQSVHVWGNLTNDFLILE